MTRYAVDLRLRTLIATWGGGGGDAATSVAQLPTDADPDACTVLAGRLTGLSATLWRTYTHPASATTDENEPSTEGWHRELDRAAFELVVDAVQNPHLPTNGMLTVSYNPVEEAAHRVGRALHALGNSDLKTAVIDEVTTELASVDDAERGDYTGRARQAVLLTRTDVSPLQVAAAHELLRSDPFGHRRLFADIDPTSAAVAAAHWLAAAAEMAGEAAGIDPEQTLIEADNIEAIAHESPTHVVEAISEGTSARDAVVALLTDAAIAADGEIPDLSGLLTRIDDAVDRAQEIGDPELVTALLPRRLTSIDITRPAPDLLEDLVSGIHACWLLYDECRPLTDDLDDEPTDDDFDDAREERAAQFVAELRRRAAVSDVGDR